MLGLRTHAGKKVRGRIGAKNAYIARRKNVQLPNAIRNLFARSTRRKATGQAQQDAKDLLEFSGKL